MTISTTIQQEKTMTKKLDDIKKILNDMKPIGSDLLIFEGCIYSGYSSYSCYWLEDNKINDFDSLPLMQNIMTLIKQLKLDGGDWNNFRLCLSKNNEFTFESKNIDEEDSWYGLYMKGISDIEENDLKNFNIPRAIWEKRTKIKKEKASSNQTQNLSDDQKIYQEMGEILWSIMPLEQKRIMLNGCIYESLQLDCYKVLDNGNLEPIHMSDEITFKLTNLVKSLQNCEIFSQEKWTCFEAILTDESKFQIKFDYLSKKDKRSEIYRDLKNVIWSAKPRGVNNVLLGGFCYKDSIEILFFEDDEDKTWVLLPSTVLPKINDLIKELQEYDLSIGRHWTHLELLITDDGVFDREFLYIPEEDHWDGYGLYMQGISDLTEEEWKNTDIPKELWEERVRHKGTGTLGRPKSDFY